MGGNKIQTKKKITFRVDSKQPIATRCVKQSHPLFGGFLRLTTVTPAPPDRQVTANAPDFRHGLLPLRGDELTESQLTVLLALLEKGIMGQGQKTVKTLKYEKKKTISMTYWLQLVQKEICIKGGYHKIILLQNSKDSIYNPSGRVPQTSMFPSNSYTRSAAAEMDWKADVNCQAMLKSLPTTLNLTTKEPLLETALEQTKTLKTHDVTMRALRINFF